MIRHGGVGDQQRVRAFHRVEEIQHLLHLLHRGDIAGVQRVKMHVLRPPVGGDSRQLVGQIPADEPRKRRVGTEHRRGHDGALHPHGGDHRQCHRQRAPPQTGDVLNGRDSFHKHTSCVHAKRKTPSEMMPFLCSHRRTLPHRPLQGALYRKCAGIAIMNGAIFTHGCMAAAVAGSR